MLQLSGKPVNINMIEFYAFTADKDDQEINQLLNCVKENYHYNGGF